MFYILKHPISDYGRSWKSTNTCNDSVSCIDVAWPYCFYSKALDKIFDHCWSNYCSMLPVPKIQLNAFLYVVLFSELRWLLLLFQFRFAVIASTTKKMRTTQHCLEYAMESQTMCRFILLLAKNGNQLSNKKVRKEIF